LSKIVCGNILLLLRALERAGDKGFRHKLKDQNLFSQKLNLELVHSHSQQFR
jgi:hypothetical protein